MTDLFFPDLKYRISDPELMDMEHIDENRLINTIKQFGLVNFLFSQSRSLIKKYFIDDMLSDKNKTYSVLDVGAGGCDIAIWLAKYSKKKGIKLKITCLDYDKRIINYIKSITGYFPDIKVVHGSAFELGKMQNFDYIFSNHFLHHLENNEIIKIINLIYQKTNKIFLLNDLYRSNLGYLGFTLFTGLFLHNSLTLTDGRSSIRKGFIVKDFENIKKILQISENINIKKIMPSRIYIYCNKKKQDKENEE